MQAGKRKSYGGRLHVKRFDALYAEALGRCRSNARSARRWALLMQLAAAAVPVNGCTNRVPGGQSCERWIADCAQHRTLVECRKDARELGCKP